MTKEFKFKSGAVDSPNDTRTYEFNTRGIPKLSWNVEYETVTDQENQGICTADAITQIATKHFGQRMSRDFQYYIQKTMYDGNWEEGSSLMSALYMANKIGFIPVSEFPDILENNPEITYQEYIGKLKFNIEPRLNELIDMGKKIARYERVTVTPEYLADAMEKSKYGLYVRVEMTDDWYTKNGVRTMKKEDICDIRNNKKVVGGHALVMTGFDFTNYKKLFWTNSWGKVWCDTGTGTSDFETVKPTEAWIIYFDEDKPKLNLDVTSIKRNLKFGMAGADVKYLQNFLKEKGYMSKDVLSTGYFGVKTLEAVKVFQKSKGIIATGNVGILTRGIIYLMTR